ncbi:hypothetical protein CF328_g7351 [Tilletia controversa]|nr:hypothetical protein CF328_g7351 [Tilletia controversa]
MDPISNPQVTEQVKGLAGPDPVSLGDPILPSTSVGALGINICGTADSQAKLVAMTNARRHARTSELKVSKTVPDLTGARDFVVWRTMLLGLFVPYLGGRYWHLLEKDPSTSVEAYRVIFSDDDKVLIDREAAIAHRTADLIAIHGHLLQTLDANVLQSVNEETSSGRFDGVKLWDALNSKYGGRDLGSKRAAEHAIKDFKLGDLSVTEAAQQLQALFTQVFLASGGRPVPEEDKIEAALTVFNTPRYQSLRTTIQESWQNGNPYTFDRIISRFVGEESLTAAAHALSRQEDSAVALRAQTSGGATGPSGAIRPNPKRRQEGKANSMTCWHCTKTGHRMKACRRRLAGEAPHPNSHRAKERAGQNQTFGPTSAAAEAFSRIAAIESALQHALGGAGNHQMRNASYGSGQQQQPHFGVPSLAHRISEQHQTFTHNGPPQGTYQNPYGSSGYMH